MEALKQLPTEPPKGNTTIIVVVLAIVAVLALGVSLAVWQSKNNMLKRSVDLEEGKEPLSPKNGPIETPGVSVVPGPSTPTNTAGYGEAVTVL